MTEQITNTFACLPSRTRLPIAFLLGVMVLAAVAGKTSAQNTNGNVPGRSQYKAAVYAHMAFIPLDETPVTRAKAVTNMEVNLKVYGNQAAEAGKQGVELIVFPEDGVYGMKFDRNTVYPYLEYMPDPTNETWNPCDEPNRYANSDAQIALSCMAKQNNLYLVANIGDRQPCDPGTDPKCPADKRYQYNTDVAYGPDGIFLARYHKINLYYEYQFDTPEPEHIYFDTPFGRFGMMTCFDVLFKEPGIPLVEKYNVTDFAFPTAWMDALPLLPAIGTHSSFARAHGVNFLAANIHLPVLRFDGSGLYGPDGARAFYYGVGLDGGLPKLLVADMDVITRGERSSAPKNVPQDPQRKDSSQSAESTVVSVDPIPEKEFESKLWRDTYTFRVLEKPSDLIKVCQGKICCELEYGITGDRFSDNELYAVGAFDGPHSRSWNAYMQNCAIVKCADAEDRKTCGSLVFASTTSFSKIYLRGDVQTKYVYPHVLLSDSRGQLRINGPGAWDFTGSAIKTTQSFNETVLNAILLGRDYTRDDEKPMSDLGDAGSRMVHSLLMLVACFGGVGLVIAIHFA